jgi:hypothetical protein
VSAVAAACGADDAALYVPLNGSAPTTVAGEPAAEALAGDVVIVSYFINTVAQDDDATDVESFKAGSSTTSVSHDWYGGSTQGYAVVSAYGAAVAQTYGDPDQPTSNVQLDSLRSATDFSPLFSPPPSPVTAGAFSLTNGRIAYTADPAVAKTSPAVVSVLSRTLTTHAHHVTASPATRPAGQHGAEDGTSQLVAASGPTTVFQVGTGANAHLRIDSPHHNANLNVDRGWTLVSSNRLLYSRGGRKFRVYDIATGRTTLVLNDPNRTTQNVALSGHYLSYSTTQAGVYRKNLRTGHTIRLAEPHPKYRFPHTAVFASGDWVGWRVQRGAGVGVDDSYLRNVSTMAKPIRLPHVLNALTSEGAVLNSASSGATTYWLRGYGGHTRLLLSTRSYVQGPQVQHGVVAWINANGNLKVARLRN